MPDPSPTRRSPLTRRGSLFSAAALLVVVLLGCARSEVEAGSEKRFTLKAFMKGYEGVGGDIDGERNPTLKLTAGDQVVVTLIGGERMAHDIALEKARAQSLAVTERGQKTVFKFTAKEHDTYFCTFPGHRAAGMVGRVEVAPAPAGSAAPSVKP
ncbi:MAG: cupredoxin domain-containing protein [Sorangiineae bacterium]|nr:cupredoxin domain-containing protein [Polyangiaceae bacterium]MEB2322466.1 cupredoxin domain-containing protein [Sorangiineae bacterium]